MEKFAKKCVFVNCNLRFCNIFLLLIFACVGMRIKSTLSCKQNKVCYCPLSAVTNSVMEKIVGLTLCRICIVIHFIQYHLLCTLQPAVALGTRRREKHSTIYSINRIIIKPGMIQMKPVNDLMRL